MPIDEYFMLVILTHEARTSASGDIFAPFVRVDDGKMYMLAVDSSSRLEVFKYFSSISSGNHVYHPNFQCYDVTEVSIEGPKGSFF